LQTESTCVTNFDLLGMEDKLKLPRYDKIKNFRHSRAHANLVSVLGLGRERVREDGVIKGDLRFLFEVRC
jgi:hypothetical protein